MGVGRRYYSAGADRDRGVPFVRTRTGRAAERHKRLSSGNMEGAGTKLLAWLGRIPLLIFFFFGTITDTSRDERLGLGGHGPPAHKEGFEEHLGLGG